ncbi:hypothetical protein ACP4OV_019337 [Aristida adscensionis]
MTVLRSPIHPQHSLLIPSSTTPMAAASASSFQSHQSQRQTRAGARGGSRWSSPERTVVWTEPPPLSSRTTNSRSSSKEKVVAVVYYLCRPDGHLDHPHFMELHHAPPLRLRHFTHRLDALRGHGMSAIYSWSSKRTYRNGYVWHDLADDDLLHPAAGEYVLKASHRLQLPQDSHGQLQQQTESTTVRRHRKTWSSLDLADDRRTEVPMEEELELEISPPPPSSSPDAEEVAGGRMRASAVLMQLISCGFKDTVTSRRGRSDVGASSCNSNSKRRVEDSALILPEMEREYFSGSLVERSSSKTMSTAALVSLRRSSSHNAGRGLKLEVKSKELEGRCIPRKQPASSSTSPAATATAAHAESSADVDTQDVQVLGRNQRSTT